MFRLNEHCCQCKFVEDAFGELVLELVSKVDHLLDLHDENVS